LGWLRPGKGPAVNVDGERPLPAEERAFFDELHELVEDVMMLRTGQVTETDVRQRLETVFLRIHALPVHGRATPSGAKLEVYLGGEDAHLGDEGPEPSGDDGVA
jgi:hypothetical protein